MTLQQISQRGKDFLKTAGSLLSAAKTMIDRVISNQLKDVAEDYQRRAEKLRMLRAGHLDPIPRSAGAIFAPSRFSGFRPSPFRVCSTI